jgi:hypothetical protein
MIPLYRLSFRYTSSTVMALSTVLALAACAHRPVQLQPAHPQPAQTAPAQTAPAQTQPSKYVEIQDLKRIPQTLTKLAPKAADRTVISDDCEQQLHAQYLRHFFAPWTSQKPIFDPTDSADFMKKESRGNWFGENKRKVPRPLLQGLLANCDLDSFPSRNDAAIAVAPAHLRGLPTPLPLYEKANDEPFDMLSYPQVKLNEPLRIMHQSADGAWLFVESAYSNGWLESRDVALVDDDFIKQWMKGPYLVITRDLSPVADGKDVGTYTAKVGTMLPVTDENEEAWEIAVASVGEGGVAELRSSSIPRGNAARFPLPFKPENVSLIGNQLIGQPYGWGEMYDLRDCSALLRDFFMPFGIWLPRTAADQIDSVRQRQQLAKLAPEEKRNLIKKRGLPFLSLLFKPGHIMLYAGEGEDGEPLVFHDAWSVRVKEEQGERKQIIGIASVTTLEPGKELGLVPNSSLLDRATEMATIPERCQQPSQPLTAK